MSEGTNLLKNFHNNNNFLKINLNNSDKLIKFRTLNKDQNFIFIKVKNTIQIYELVKFNLVYTFHLNEEIINFEIFSLDSSVILNTTKNLQIHELNTDNLEDYNLKINYNLKILKDYEKIVNLSISTLGDLIAILDYFHIIKILNKKLEIIKNIKQELSFFSNWPSNLNSNSILLENFNLQYFNFTYDTKNICLCKYNDNKISFIYKNKFYSEPVKGNNIDLNFSHFDNLKNPNIYLENNNLNNTIYEYIENLIELNNKIIYLKEMQKDISCYLENENSSIFFLLAENLNFNIMRKVFDIQTNKPQLIILTYIDLSMSTDYLNYPNISFSLLYDNQNPIFNNKNNLIFENFDFEKEIFKDKNSDNSQSRIFSGIIHPEIWQNTNTNNLENPDGFFQTTSFYFKNISTDYFIFNFYENIILYKIEGLNSYAYNNINVETLCRVFPDDEYSNNFILLKMTKTLDSKYCIYFIDENNLIRKYYFKPDNINRIYSSEKFLKIYSNIITVKFNEMNRKTLILEYRNKDSLIFLLNSKLEFTQMILLKGILVENLKWVENSDFIIFQFKNNLIAIINYFSKFFTKSIIELDEKSLGEKFNIFSLPIEEKNKLIDIKINTNFIGILNKVIIKSNYLNEIKFIFLAITLDLEIFLIKVSIEENNSLVGESEHSIKFSVVRKYDLDYKDLCISPEALKYQKNHEETTENNQLILYNVYLNKNIQIIKKNFLFTEKSLFYYTLDQKLKIFSVIEINQDLNKNIVFQTMLLDEFLYINIFTNNYLIFITKLYINCFDLSTYSFNRVKNEFINSNNLNKINIDLIKFGTFPYLFFTYSNEIKFVRIPRNKNIQEEFQLEFIYNEEVSLINTKLILKNDFILLNPSQIFKVFEITKKKHDIELEDDRFFLLLINSNPISLFDMQTFLDFFLSGNEEIVKLILNMFCSLYYNIPDFEEKYKNPKLVPNFLNLENIDYLYKIIFDNELNVLSMIGKEENIINSSDLYNQNNKKNQEENYEYGLGNQYNFIITAEKNTNEKNLLKKNSEHEENYADSIDEYCTVTKEQQRARINSVNLLTSKLSVRNSISIKLQNPKLQFLAEKDNQDSNPINILSNKNKNYLYLKNIYDIISQEQTRNIDNFTKYMILKITSKNKDFEKDTFKFSTADLCWITFISDQDYFIKFLSKNNKGSVVTWKFMRMFSVPLWIKSDLKLKDLIETMAKNEIKEITRLSLQGISAEQSTKNIAENVALYFLLIGKKNVCIDLFNKEPWNDNVKKFIMRDFSIAKNRKIARENADDLFKKKKFIYAAFFYLLADDVRGAVDMALLKLKDINLTVTILRLYTSPYAQVDKYTYTMEMLLQEYFINFGITIRDPWLVLFGYVSLKKLDIALEYILNYDCKYFFQENKDIMENIEYFGNNIEIIKNIFGINTFDYKLLIFAKNLEKIYLKQLEENKINVKSVENTNFDDIWGFDEDEDSNSKENNNMGKVQNNSDESKKVELKDILIDYKNLSKLCLTNSLSRGILYAPIINIYRSYLPGNNFYLEYNNREMLKNLVCERIVLDIAYLNQDKIDKYFLDVELFFDKLEENKILKKQEIYYEINKILLWFDRYRSCAIPCKKSNKLTDNLIRIGQFTEKLISKQICFLIDFNIPENINLNNIKDSILIKIKDVCLFLKNLIEYEEKLENEEKLKKNLPNLMFDSTINLQIKTEQNLLIFRIIFTNFFYLLFCTKIIFSYNKVYKIFLILNELVQEYHRINKFNEKAKKYLDLLLKYIDYLDKNIISKQISKNSHVYLYIQILNFSFISQLYEFLKKNISLIKFDGRKTLKNAASLIQSKLKPEINYVHESFKFIPFIMSYLDSYLENFDNNFDRYTKKYMTISFFSEIHEELKMIYMKDLKNDQNFFKFLLIPIKILFKCEEKLKNFEEIFKVKENVIKYISGIFKYVEYEKNLKPKNINNNPSSFYIKDETEKNKENLEECDENSYTGYTPESIKFIHGIFKSGIEIVNYGDANCLNGFALNSCDPSNLVVALGINGHRKINILFNLLIRKRSDDFQKLIDAEPSNQDEIFVNCRDIDFVSLISNQIFFKYNEILTIIQNDICKKLNKNLFNSISPLPPHWYMDYPSEYFKENISTNNITNSMFANNIISHPLLPLYSTTNNRGIISIWSYESDGKKSINDYSIEPLGKESLNKTKIIKKIKFNSYGNEFITLEETGNLYLFNFSHDKDNKLPYNFLSPNQTKGITKDFCYLNNSGILATTTNKNKDNFPFTMLWDFLLPNNQNNIGEIGIGGNIISSLASNSTILVANEKPGSISFLDIRKMEIVNSFQAHLDEIKSMKISERENILVTYGKDGFVKLWNLTNKTSPKLIDSLQPYQIKDNTKVNLNLEIFNGMLFASNENSIKFIRNKIY